jgi:3-hydroxyisobutyrate dehydrogenase-like beta-hydroxyacid dehydrogenase
MSDKFQVSIIGTGRMGAALSMAILRSGYTLHAWNRTASKLAPLVAKGARPAASLLEAVRSSEVVILNVRDYATSDELLRSEQVSKALRGKVIVQLCSGSPAQAREAADWAQKHGIGYLDGAIMATPNLIGEPGGTILYSGPRSVFERLRPLLLTLGGNTQHVGEDPGHASALDAALLFQMWGALFGALQGFAICRAEGVPAIDYAAQLRAIGPMVEGALGDLIDRVVQGRLAADDSTLATLETHYGAFRHLLALHEERGLHDALPRAMERVFQPAMEAGHGSDDFSVLSRYLA